MTLSEERHARAQRLMPGGVNSPVRAFGAVGGAPVYIESAHGAFVKDIEGRDYIDYVASWGPMILGHAFPTVVEAVIEAARKGLSFGAPTEYEIQLAEKVIERVPNLEMVRMVNSGTEAAMSVLRLARGVTGRPAIIKFAGGYHGHVDSMLVKAGSGATTFGSPNSPGVTDGAAADTLVCRYNDLADVQATFEAHGPRIAAVILEPVAGNMGCIPPTREFLDGLRSITHTHGALLIYDEVMTGFRVHPGGAQALFEQKPDLSIFGKVIGGGMPVGAYGGRRDLMAQISPVGSIYQAGTLSGNPCAMAAGLATLAELAQPGVYEKLETMSERLVKGLRAAGQEANIPVQVTHVGSMVGLFFSEKPVTNYDEATAADSKRYAAFFHGMLERGVYLAPSAFETLFVSLAHTEELIDQTIQAATDTLKALAR